MSILIKMGMPTTCARCPMCHDYRGCMLLHKSFGEFDCVEYRWDYCPLVELPPHGDLIDKSKLPLAFIDVTDLPTDRCLPVYLQEDVDDAPIVVESEE